MIDCAGILGWTLDFLLGFVQNEHLGHIYCIHSSSASSIISISLDAPISSPISRVSFPLADSVIIEKSVLSLVLLIELIHEGIVRYNSVIEASGSNLGIFLILSVVESDATSSMIFRPLLYSTKELRFFSR